MALGCIAIACSSNDGPSSSGPSSTAGGGTSVGGKSSTGGSSTTATGGSSNTGAGGQSTGQGGSAATGGNSTAAGGAATGGTSSGATGGASTGGKSSTAATGGAATGGKSSTAATGGASTGGKSSTAATGGAATGGKSSTAATGGSTEAGGETSTGGTTAAGGTSGAGGSTAGGEVIPTKVTVGTQTEYQFKVGDITMVVNPAIGGRIVSLTVGSTNIIQPHTATTYNGNDSSNNAGITFWTSPQSSWSPTWPPVAAIDGNAYTVTDNGGTSGHLVLTGSADTALGASVVKDISADSATGWITVKYTIKATKAIQAAAWQIARVPRAGLVFFPATTTPIKSPTVTWTLSQTSGYDWIDDKNQTSVSAASDGSKYVVNGAAVSGKTYTILGYALGGNLLLLKYPDATTFATGEGDTEVYPGAGYMELEAQGNYGSIAANATSSWTIQMRVDPVDTGSVTVASGSATLISFAEQQAAL